MVPASCIRGLPSLVSSRRSVYVRRKEPQRRTRRSSHARLGQSLCVRALDYALAYVPQVCFDKVRADHAVKLALKGFI